jgi:hypothetical protein
MEKQPAAFVVRFSQHYFYTGRDERLARGTLFPSFARILTYLTAAEVARSLRELNYSDAIVTNLYGVPVLPEETVAADVRSTNEFQDAWRTVVAAQ